MFWRWLARKLCPYLIDEVVRGQGLAQLLALTKQQRLQSDLERQKEFFSTESPR